MLCISSCAPTVAQYRYKRLRAEFGNAMHFLLRSDCRAIEIEKETGLQINLRPVSFSISTPLVAYPTILK